MKTRKATQIICVVFFFLQKSLRDGGEKQSVEVIKPKEAPWDSFILYSFIALQKQPVILTPKVSSGFFTSFQG